MMDSVDVFRKLLVILKLGLAIRTNRSCLFVGVCHGESWVTPYFKANAPEMFGSR